MNISVCLASYNGSLFIEKQIQSVLNQLNQDDELIMVDDCSKDNTLQIVTSINDSRIKIYPSNSNKGCIKAFEQAISLANNEIIFMCDQDDIWLEGRISLMKKRLIEQQVLLVSSNMNFIDEAGNEVKSYTIDGVKEAQSKKFIQNIMDIFKGKTNYFGCAMAFKKELNNIILPFPKYVESHDLWIAMAANIMKSNYHCGDITLSRRIHGNNLSVINRKLSEKLWSRVIFAMSFVHILIRKIK